MHQADSGTASASAGAAMSAFLAELPGAGGAPDAVSVFHAVRRLPYHSSGDRSLAGILAARRGSCSSKHILLAALLNRIGVRAEVELVRGDFATPLRNARNIPAAMREAGASGVPDIHSVVRAWVAGGPVLLDATWHDAVKPYGFRVNEGWDGAGDTQVAVDAEEFLGPSANPAALKAALLAQWPDAIQRRRREFLNVVNEWVASLETPPPEKKQGR